MTTTDGGPAPVRFDMDEKSLEELLCEAFDAGQKRQAWVLFSPSERDVYAMHRDAWVRTAMERFR